MALSCLVAGEIKREDDDKELNAEYTTQYKSIVARGNYMSTDRPDIQFVVKKLATHMSKPTNRNRQELKVLGRYLKSKPRPLMKYEWQNPITVLTSVSDSDWAGDRKITKIHIRRCNYDWFTLHKIVVKESISNCTIWSRS